MDSFVGTVNYLLLFTIFQHCVFSIVKSKQWFLHCKSLQGLMGCLQDFPVVGKPCNIYRLRGNPINIMGFPRNLYTLQGLSTTYIGFLCDSYRGCIHFVNSWLLKALLASSSGICWLVITVHTIQIGGLNVVLFWQGFDNFLGVYVLYKVDMHQKNLNSAKIFQEINIFASFLLSCSCMSKILYRNIQILNNK